MLCLCKKAIFGNFVQRYDTFYFLGSFSHLVIHKKSWALPKILIEETATAKTSYLISLFGFQTKYPAIPATEISTTTNTA